MQPIHGDFVRQQIQRIQQGDMPQRTAGDPSPPETIGKQAFQARRARFESDASASLLEEQVVQQLESDLDTRSVRGGAPRPEALRQAHDSEQTESESDESGVTRAGRPSRSAQTPGGESEGSEGEDAEIGVTTALRRDVEPDEGENAESEAEDPGVSRLQVRIQAEAPESESET